MTHDPRVEHACKAYTEKENSLLGINLSWPDDYLYDCLDGVIREAITAALAAADAARKNPVAEAMAYEAGFEAGQREEREACIKAVEGFEKNRDWVPGSLYETLRREAARDIRSRSEIANGVMSESTMLAAADAAAPQSQWRDIKDAPRDGTEILICDAREGVFIASWDDTEQGSGWYVPYTYQMLRHATRWALLPSFPEGVE